jgi:hypothetical protein
MNAGAGERVSAAMSSRDPKVEATVERMYSAMRTVINNAPLGVTGLAIGACAGVTDEDQHATAIVRLMTLARMYPEMRQAVERLVDLLLEDKLPQIRQAMVKG